MALLFGTIAGILLMLTVAGIIGPVSILAIGLGLIIGGVLVAPVWAAYNENNKIGGMDK